MTPVSPLALGLAQSLRTAMSEWDSSINHGFCSCSDPNGGTFTHRKTEVYLSYTVDDRPTLSGCIHIVNVYGSGWGSDELTEEDKAHLGAVIEALQPDSLKETLVWRAGETQRKAERQLQTHRAAAHFIGLAKV